MGTDRRAPPTSWPAPPSQPGAARGLHEAARAGASPPRPGGSLIRGTGAHLPAPAIKQGCRRRPRPPVDDQGGRRAAQAGLAVAVAQAADAPRSLGGLAAAQASAAKACVSIAEPTHSGPRPAARRPFCQSSRQADGGKPLNQHFAQIVGSSRSRQRIRQGAGRLHTCSGASRALQGGGGDLHDLAQPRGRPRVPFYGPEPEEW